MRISDWSSDVCSSDRFAAARAVATVQDLAEGRFLFGVGTGWMREEFDAVGEALDGRGGRTDEMIQVKQELQSAERRVGKECVSTCRSGGRPCHILKNKHKKTCRKLGKFRKKKY